MAWIETFELWIRNSATQLPLEVFVFFGSIVEELIGPIPSTLVMTTAGALAHIQDYALVFVVWLALLGATGKTLAAWGYYVLGDKLEDAAIRRFGHYLGVKHEDVESIGQRFGRSHWKDGGALLILRLIPFFPSTVISIACGMIKIHLHAYLPATWVGSFVKDFLYAYTGYAGVTVLHRWWQDAERLRWGIDLVIAILIGLFILGLVWHWKSASQFLVRLVERYRTK